MSPVIAILSRVTYFEKLFFRVFNCLSAEARVYQNQKLIFLLFLFFFNPILMFVPIARKSRSDHHHPNHHRHLQSPLIVLPARRGRRTCRPLIERQTADVRPQRKRKPRLPVLIAHSDVDLCQQFAGSSVLGASVLLAMGF